jgi:hypothetical protein
MATNAVERITHRPVLIWIKISVISLVEVPALSGTA